MDKFKKLKIPVPSLEKQKEIIEYCESNNNLIKQLENEIEQNKIQANLFLSNIVKKVKIEQDEISDDDSNSVKSNDL
jgi:restriction endonuclease S subunit